jgi:hypothetical protein
MITASPRHSLRTMVVHALVAALAVVALMTFIMLARDLATSTVGDPQGSPATRGFPARHVDRTGHLVPREPAAGRRAGQGDGR